MAAEHVGLSLPTVSASTTKLEHNVTLSGEENNKAISCSVEGFSTAPKDSKQYWGFGDTSIQTTPYNNPTMGLNLNVNVAGYHYQIGGDPVELNGGFAVSRSSGVPRMCLNLSATMEHTIDLTKKEQI